MNYIINPLTNEVYSIFSDDGKKLLKEYVRFYQTGGSEGEEEDDYEKDLAEFVEQDAEACNNSQYREVGDCDNCDEGEKKDTCEFVHKTITSVKNEVEKEAAKAAEEEKRKEQEINNIQRAINIQGGIK